MAGQEPAAESATPPTATPTVDLKALAGMIADRLTPKRTILDEGGVKAKPGETPVFHGGHDLYTVQGRDDADVAVNMFIAKTLVETPNPRTGRPDHQASERLEHVLLSAATKAVKAAPRAVPTDDRDGFLGATYKMLRGEAAYKAMTSTGTNAGDEWVPTFASAELWNDIHFATQVTAQLTRVDMPTNPYTLPTLDADVTFKYASSENVAVTASNLNTGNATLTAVKIMGEVDFSGELTEDSIIPIVPSIRANLVRRGAQTMDDLIVHGDTETGGTGNVNLDDAAPTAGDFFLAQSGMRKFCVVTNTGQTSNVAAALTSANFNTLRGLLDKHGARSSDLFIVVDGATFVAMNTIAEVVTPDKYGPGATVLRGELGRFFNIPIFLSETIPLLTTGKTEADGKASTTAANNTKGWILVIHRNGWKIGFRRELRIESFRDIQKDQNILTASWRQAVIPSGINVTHTAYGRNVTV